MEKFKLLFGLFLCFCPQFICADPPDFSLEKAFSPIFPNGTIVKVKEIFEPENKKNIEFRYKLFVNKNASAIGLEYNKAPLFPHKKILFKRHGQDIWTLDEPMGRLRKKSRHQFVEPINYNGYSYKYFFLLPMLNDSLKFVESYNKENMNCYKYLNPFPDYEEFITACATDSSQELHQIQFLNRYDNVKAKIELNRLDSSKGEQKWELLLEAEEGLSRIYISNPKDTVFPADFKKGLSLN